MLSMVIFLAVFLGIRFCRLFWNFALQAYFQWEAFVFVFLFPFIHLSWASGFVATEAQLLRTPCTKPGIPELWSHGGIGDIVACFLT